jgi:hypothetical protein
MIDFRPLDHETRTVALVGRFLQLWATLEYEVDRTIAKVLGITSAQHFVLAKNIPFFNKTHILRTLLEFLPIDDELEKFNDLLKDIQNYYGHRNMMAHDLFASSDSTDGVRFFVVRAKGKFAAPDINWGVDRFLEAFADISVYTAGLNGNCSPLITVERG